MNLLSQIIYYYKRKIEPGFKIDKNALVVDIGSGDKPFWRADVFVDKLSLGNTQRASDSNTINTIGTFVDADVLHLPFKDKAFDFSFSSHLLEHVNDPEKAIKEIMRISKAGYFEVPNGILETILPFHGHLWFIYDNNNTLVFSRKGKHIHDVLLQNSKKYANLILKIKKPFIQVYWEKKIKFEILDTYKEHEKFYAKYDKRSSIISHPINFHTILLVKILRFLFYKKKEIPNSIYKHA